MIKHTKRLSTNTNFQFVPKSLWEYKEYTTTHNNKKNYETYQKNILLFLDNPENIGVEKWDILFASGENLERCFDITDSIRVKCINRSIFYGTRNVVQISSRRRALSGNSEGKAGLTQQQIEEVEKKFKTSGGSGYVPVKAYFENLPNRKPILVILPIVPNKPTSPEEEHDSLTKFREELGDDLIFAFAIGLPGVKGVESAVHYKINKVYQRLNIEDAEEEEVDDET